ncbi:MAG: hypothetical protein ACRDYX_23290 [Egibacteraceae bacterium]
MAIVLEIYAFVSLTAVGTIPRKLGELRGTADRAFVVIEDPANVTDRGQASVGFASPPDVRFEDVSFCYRPDDPDALRGATFEMPAGAGVALVGHSGTDKSTCANLLSASGIPPVGGASWAAWTPAAYPRTAPPHGSSPTMHEPPGALTGGQEAGTGRWLGYRTSAGSQCGQAPGSGWSAAQMSSALASRGTNAPGGHHDLRTSRVGQVVM